MHDQGVNHNVICHCVTVCSDSIVTAELHALRCIQSCGPLSMIFTIMRCPRQTKRSSNLGMRTLPCRGVLCHGRTPCRDPLPNNFCLAKRHLHGLIAFAPSVRKSFWFATILKMRNCLHEEDYTKVVPPEGMSNAPTSGVSPIKMLLHICIFI